MNRLERWLVRFGFALTLMTLLGNLGNLDLDERPWWQIDHKTPSKHVDSPLRPAPPNARAFVLYTPNGDQPRG